MLKKSLLATALTSLVWGLSGTAVAEDAKAAEEPKSPHSMTGNVTFATNYVFRGLSQTNFKPAIQGTLEYGHASGLYVGFFASNASWYGDAWEEGWALAMRLRLHGMRAGSVRLPPRKDPDQVDPAWLRAAARASLDE